MCKRTRFYHSVGLRNCKCITPARAGCQHPRDQAFLAGGKGDFMVRREHSVQGGEEQHGADTVGEIPAVRVPSDAMGTKGEQTISEERINIYPPSEEYFRRTSVAWLLGEPYQSPGARGQGRIKPFYIEIYRSGVWVLGSEQFLQAAGSSCLVPLMLPAHPAARRESKGSSYLPDSWGCSCFPCCCSVRNCAVNGLVGGRVRGHGCPSWFPGSGCWWIHGSG